MINHTVQYLKSPAAPVKSSGSALGRPKDAAKRDQIIRAASMLFMTDGYVRTSMEAVARKADVSKLTIYSHFKDKDALFRQVIGRRCHELMELTDFAACVGEPVEPALLKLGMSMAGHIFSPESIRIHRVMQAEALHHPQVVQMFYEAGPLQVRKAFGDLLRNWCRAGQLAIADISTATEQFFSLLKGELMMRVILKRGAPPDAAAIRRHVKSTVTMFLAAYRS